MTAQIITDSSSTTRYKVITENGEVLAIEPSKMLADLFLDRLTEEQKRNCKVVPITEDNKDILLG